MTADEVILELDRKGHIAIVAVDMGKFFVYTCPMDTNYILDMDNQTDCGEPCDTIDEALANFALQFSRNNE